MAGESVILYLAAPGKDGQATIEVDGTLDEALSKLMPGILIDFRHGDERFLVNAAQVTHARARRKSADLPESQSIAPPERRRSF